MGPSLEASAVYPFSRMMQLRPNSVLHRNSQRFGSSIRSHIPMHFLILNHGSEVWQWGCLVTKMAEELHWVHVPYLNMK